jgi:hypothetical protein
MSVTKLGVSLEKVVATIEIPSSHQGIFLPERKNSEELLPAFLETASPMARDKIKNPTTNPQSIACNIIGYSS